MFSWIIIFLVIGLIAALLGMGGVASFAFAGAKFLFFIFLVLLILAIAFGRSLF